MISFMLVLWMLHPPEYQWVRVECSIQCDQEPVALWPDGSIAQRGTGSVDLRDFAALQRAYHYWDEPDCERRLAECEELGLDCVPYCGAVSVPSGCNLLRFLIELRGPMWRY